MARRGRTQAPAFKGRLLRLIAPPPQAASAAIAKKSPELNSGDFLHFVFKNYFRLSATATATATVAPYPGMGGPIPGALPIQLKCPGKARPFQGFPAENAWRGLCRVYGRRRKKGAGKPAPFEKFPCIFYFRLSATATATATVAPTMGLLPMPRKPIISTWAGTEEEPANWASECIRPMVSVMP